MHNYIYFFFYISAFELCRQSRLSRLRHQCLTSNVTSDALFGTYDVISDPELLRRVEHIIKDDKHGVLLDAIPKTGQTSIIRPRVLSVYLLVIGVITRAMPS